MPKLRTYQGRIILVNKRPTNPPDLNATLTKALGPGWETDTAEPTTTLTGINFTPTGIVQAGAAVGTVLGSLFVTRKGGAPRGLVYALVGTAAANFRIVANQVQVNNAAIAAGSLTFRVRASVTNAPAAVEADLTVTIGGATTPATATLTGILFASAGTVRAGAAVGTLLGTLGVTSTGAAPAGLAFALASTTALDVRIVGNRVEVNNAGAAPGDLTFQVDASATNGATIRRPVTVAISAAVTEGGNTLIETTGIPLRRKARAAYPAGSPLTHGISFAKGEFPAGSRLRMAVAGSGGVAVPVQTDQHARFPDGSVMTCSLSYRAPQAMAAGQVIEFRITRENVAEDRTPVRTAAQVRAASDIHLRLHGLDLSGEFRVSFNDVTSGVSEHSPMTGFGTNPLRGWEPIRTGPICSEWRAWSYAVNTVDGQPHRWLVGEVYVREWVGGFREITPVLGQPNAYAAHPAGVHGPAVETRTACFVELRDGGTLLYAFGGSDSPRALDVPVSGFRTGAAGSPGASNYASLGINSLPYWAHGSAVALSGAIPSGLSAGEVLYPYHEGENGSTFTAFARNRWDGVRNNRGSAQVSWSDTPTTGTVRISPVQEAYVGTKTILMLPDAMPFWQGPSARPDCMGALDEVHLTRRARTVPPYRLTDPRPQADDGANLQSFVPGSLAQHMSALDEGTDDRDEDRIGYLPVTHAALVVLPWDAPRRRKAIIQGLQWAGMQMWYQDHASGRPLVLNNGLDKAGALYPGLGPSNTEFGVLLNGDTRGNPPWIGTSAARHNEGTVGHPGFAPRYQVPVHGSHLPDFTTMPYLLTGHHVFTEVAMATAHAAMSSNMNRNHNYSGTMYYGGIMDSGRTQGWTLRAMGQAEAIMPTAHPSRRMLSDMLDDFAVFYGRISSTDRMRNVGIYWAYYANIGSKLWMNAIFLTAMGMEVRRGVRDDKWATIYQAMMNFEATGMDDQGPFTGAGWLVNTANFHNSQDASGNDWANVASFLGQYKTPPLPLTGVGEDGLDENGGRHPYYNDLPNGYPQMHEASLALGAANHAEGKVSASAASRVRSQLRGRFNPPGGAFPTRFPFVDQPPLSGPGKMLVQNSGWRLVGPGRTGVAGRHRRARPDDLRRGWPVAQG